MFVIQNHKIYAVKLYLIQGIKGMFWANGSCHQCYENVDDYEVGNIWIFSVKSFKNHLELNISKTNELQI